MESQPENPEFKINHEDFHPCISLVKFLSNGLFFFYINAWYIGLFLFSWNRLLNKK